MDRLSALIPGIADPFTLIAALLVGLAYVLFIATRRERLAYKGIPVSGIAIIVCVAALVALALNIARVVNETSGNISATPTRTTTLQVTFYGTKAHTEAVTVPFRVSSGQVNVGCGESRGTQTSFSAPLAARDITAVPTWENVRDVKAQEKALAVQGTVVTATGLLVGRDREWTGNCPGGGHGELVVSGSYVIDQTGKSDKVVLSSFQGFVQPHTTNEIPLPPFDAAQNPISCEIVVAGVGGTTVRESLELRIDAAGNVSSTVTKPAESRGVKARIEGKVLVVDVP